MISARTAPALLLFAPLAFFAAFFLVPMAVVAPMTWPGRPSACPVWSQRAQPRIFVPVFASS